MQRDHEEPAGGQFERPGLSSVVAGRRVAASHGEGDARRGDETECDREEAHERPRESTSQERTGQHQSRPEEVELLLDGKRPEVDEWARLAVRGEVAVFDGGPVPVGEVHGRRGGVATEILILERLRGRLAHGDGEHDDDPCRREQPTRPPRIEPRQANPSPLLHLGDQESGDEVARQHEEDVDADEAAWQPVGTQVEHDHGGDRQCSDPVDLGSIGRPCRGPANSDVLRQRGGRAPGLHEAARARHLGGRAREPRLAQTVIDGYHGPLTARR